VPKHIIKVLFSPVHGLFVWTPVVALSFVGLYLMYKKKKDIAAYLILAVALQLYFNSAIVDWHGSWSFGARRFVSCTVIFGLGLAYFIDFLKKKVSPKAISLTCFLFILWNLLLVAQVNYYHPLIDPRFPFYRILIGQIKTAPKLLVRLAAEIF
jgi:hypothetical protein